METYKNEDNENKISQLNVEISKGHNAWYIQGDILSGTTDQLTFTTCVVSSIRGFVGSNVYYAYFTVEQACYLIGGNDNLLTKTYYAPGKEFSLNTRKGGVMIIVY